MSLPVDLVNLVLYCVQQLGVVLGVGAQTVMLITFLIATRDGLIEQKEEQFGRAVAKVLNLGLWLMVLSGLCITAIHITFGQLAIVETPAFLSKWALIIAIGAITYYVERRPFAHFFWEGILGAQWYALFVIHVLAPLVAWIDILVLYVVGSAGFMLAWSALVYSMREKHTNPVATKPTKVVPERLVQKVLPPPPPPPKPVAPPPAPTPKPVSQAALPHKPDGLPAPALPAIAQTHAVSTPPVMPPTKPIAPRPPIPPVPAKPKIAVPEKPAEDPDKNPGLPAIRVMPKSPGELETQMRASSVQFE